MSSTTARTVELANPVELYLSGLLPPRPKTGRKGSHKAHPLVGPSPPGAGTPACRCGRNDCTFCHERWERVFAAHVDPDYYGFRPGTPGSALAGLDTTADPPIKRARASKHTNTFSKAA